MEGRRSNCNVRREGWQGGLGGKKKAKVEGGKEEKGKGRGYGKQEINYTAKTCFEMHEEQVFVAVGMGSNKKCTNKRL